FTKLTKGDIEAIYTVRLELEPLAAVLACHNLESSHFENLETLVADMLSAQQQRDLKRLVKQDLAFHRLIWNCSNNEPLVKALDLVCAPLFTFYVIYFPPDLLTTYSSDFQR